MAVGRILIVFILCFSYDIRNCGADITPVDKTYIAIDNEDLNIIWVYDNEGDVFNVEWSFQNKTATSPIAVMVKFSPNAAVKVDPDFNIVNGGNGNVTITELTQDYEGIYYCTVVYTGAIYPTVTGTATVKIETSNGDTGGLSTGAIVGIAIGSIVLVILIAVVVWYLCFH